MCIISVMFYIIIKLRPLVLQVSVWKNIMKEDIACAEILLSKRCLFSWVLARKVAPIIGYDYDLILQLKKPKYIFGLVGYEVRMISL